jgi:hypothetical protein
MYVLVTITVGDPKKRNRGARLSNERGSSMLDESRPVYGCAAETNPPTSQTIRATTAMTMARKMALAAMTKTTSSADENMTMEVIGCLLSWSRSSVARSGRRRNWENY